MKKHLVKGGNLKKDVYFWRKTVVPSCFVRALASVRFFFKNHKKMLHKKYASEANLPHCAYCSGLGINAIGHTLSWWFGCNFDHKKYTLRVLRAIKKCHLCGR